MSRIGRALAFHASTDGAWWQLVRHFALEMGDELLAGFEAQSPLGEGCTAFFGDIRYEVRTLPDIRFGRLEARREFPASRMTPQTRRRIATFGRDT